MPGQLNAVDFGTGNTITTLLSSFTVKLPSMIQLAKIDDHTVMATINIGPLLPKWVPAFVAAVIGLRQVTWNLDSGTLLVR